MGEEKFIVRVVRHRTTPAENTAGKKDEIDQIYEQEFKALDIGEFVMNINKPKGKQDDEKSIKV